MTAADGQLGQLQTRLGEGAAWDAVPVRGSWSLQNDIPEQSRALEKQLGHHHTAVHTYLHGKRSDAPREKQIVLWPLAQLWAGRKW